MPVADFKDSKDRLQTDVDLSDYFCPIPFEQIEIGRNLEVYNCCPSWLPLPIGVSSGDDLMSLWNNEIVQDIRRSIHDGSFKYCDKKICPKIQGRMLPKKSELHRFREIIELKRVNLETPPVEIALCYDLTCNLACPSCRTNKIALTQGEEFETKMRFTEKILGFIDQYSPTNRILLRITGSGDPFASHIFMSLLKKIDAKRHRHLRLVLQTNGVMFTQRMWERLKNIHGLIEAVSISIDAATEETYRIVRKGGSWKQLMINLEFIASLKAQKEVKVISLNFVVQNENYHEVPTFVELALKLKHVDEVFFSFVVDWDTWSKEDYEKQCVWKTSHPKYQDLLRVLRSPLLDHKIVILGNLTEYRHKALRSAGESRFTRLLGMMNLPVRFLHHLGARVP